MGAEKHKNLSELRWRIESFVLGLDVATERRLRRIREGPRKTRSERLAERRLQRLEDRGEDSVARETRRRVQQTGDYFCQGCGLQKPIFSQGEEKFCSPLCHDKVHGDLFSIRWCKWCGHSLHMQERCEWCGGLSPVGSL